MERIAVVTGASRAAGKGIALALGAAGATVYVTGRSIDAGDSRYGGTVAETVQLITDAGELGIAIAVDHADDQAVAALFGRIKQEHGKLDILVNNAADLNARTIDAGSFWEKPLEAVELLNVGPRSHFAASYYAAPLLIANGRGLIVNTGHQRCRRLLCQQASSIRDLIFPFPAYMGIEPSKRTYTPRPPFLLLGILAMFVSFRAHMVPYRLTTRTICPPRANYFFELSIAAQASFTELPSSRVEALNMSSPSRLNTATLLRCASNPLPPS
jgi:hypothetical protein